MYRVNICVMFSVHKLWIQTLSLYSVRINLGYNPSDLEIITEFCASSKHWPLSQATDLRFNYKYFNNMKHEDLRNINAILYPIFIYVIYTYIFNFLLHAVHFGTHLKLLGIQLCI
jgi:hypothetical protein